MKYTVFIFSVLLLACAGCKKKEKEPTKEELLQSGKWKLTSANFNGFFDLMSSFKDCQKDNTYTFNSNRTITTDEGASKCSDTATQTSTDGKWSLLDNDAKLNISESSFLTNFGATSITGDIVSLTNTTLQIKKDTSVSGISGSVNIVFTNAK